MSKVSRRDFLTASSALGGTLVVPAHAQDKRATASARTPAARAEPSSQQKLDLTLNATALRTESRTITSAVYHATGKRVRDLPVRIEDLLG